MPQRSLPQRPQFCVFLFSEEAMQTLRRCAQFVGLWVKEEPTCLGDKVTLPLCALRLGEEEGLRAAKAARLCVFLRFSVVPPNASLCKEFGSKRPGLLCVASIRVSLLPSPSSSLRWEAA